MISRLRLLHIFIRLTSGFVQIISLILGVLPVLIQLHELLVDIVYPIINSVNLHLHLVHGQILLSLGLFILHIHLCHRAVVLRLGDLVSHLCRLHACRRTVILGLRAGKLQLCCFSIKFT